jgi:hypothetical protein
MKVRTVIRIIVEVLLGVTLAGLIALTAVKISFFNETVFDYAISHSEYITVLSQEINENAKPTVESFDLGHVLDIEESLEAFVQPCPVQCERS